MGFPTPTITAMQRYAPICQNKFILITDYYSRLSRLDPGYFSFLSGTVLTGLLQKFLVHSLKYPLREMKKDINLLLKTRERVHLN